MKKLTLLAFLSMPALYFSGCGTDAKLVAESPEGDNGETPAEDGGDDAGGDSGGEVAPKISYAQMQQHLNIYCQRCHASDTFMQSEKLLRASSVKARIANGSMPTPGAKPLPSNIKTDMLNFF